MASTFATPAIERKPNRICVGRVASVGDAYEGKSGKYYNVKITIEPLDAGSRATLYFLFRPEWMAQLSQVDLINLKEADSGAHFVYRKSIATNEENEQSILQGLSVTTDDFNALASRLIGLGVENVAANPTIVSDVLRTFLVEENGERNIGYVLKQQMQKTDEVHPETGKAVYIPTKNWEVDTYFNANDEKAIARQTKKAASNPTRYQMTYSGSAF